MTTMTETSFRKDVLEYIGETAAQSLKSMNAHVDAMRRVARVLDLAIVDKPMDASLGEISEAIYALEASIAKPATNSSIAALKEIVADKEKAQRKLEALQDLLNGKIPSSVLDQFKFRRIDSEQVEFVVPKGMSVIQAFEILNTEAYWLGIDPAVAARHFDWFKKETKAAEVQKEDLRVVLCPAVKASAGMSLADIEKAYTLQDEGLLALANALEWIASTGKINSFFDKDGKFFWVRGKVAGFGLGRDKDGVVVHGIDGGPGVRAAASSGPVKKHR